MKSRIRMIMEILIKENRECTAKELSLKLDVSEKTVRNELAAYLEAQAAYPVKLTARKNGYQIRTLEMSEKDIRQFLQRLDLTDGDEQDREKYILKKLLLNGEYVKLESLADELFVSIPTVNRIFKNVKETLSEYQLTVFGRPGYGVRVSGDEINKRLCYVHCLSQAPDENVAMMAEQCGMEEEDYCYIDYAIRKALEKYDFDLTETGIRNLTIHLMYAITRMKKGSFIKDIRWNEGMTEKEKKVAKALIKDLEEEYRIVFPETETAYICVHLSGKRANWGTENVTVSEETENLISQINHKIKSILGYNFLNDPELRAMLAMHIEPMLSRSEFGIQVPNPVLKEIKGEFPNAYECAVIAADHIREHYGLTISDDELGYLSLHYNLAIDRLIQNSGDSQILVVCGSGISTARMIQKKIEKKFQVSRDHITLCSMRELRTKDLSGYDVVISSVKIPFPVEKRVVYMEDILDDISIESATSDRLLLKNYISDGLVFFKQDFKTREQIIDFLCGKIDEVYGVGETFRELVWKRENLSSTDIGNLVAIPHAFSMCTEETIFSLCTLKKAVKWKQRKVKYIFLISFGKKDMEISHDLNEKMMTLLMDSKWISQLETADNAEDLRRILEGSA